MEYVGIYNRCSTQEENQKNALEVQAAESLELANGKEDWILVEQYIESGSGTGSAKRKEYLRMVKDIEEGRFTLIMIKSIDRLARNTKDWYLFLDLITRKGVKLYLYLEGKFYCSEDSLLTGIKAILAEEFSRELSKKIRNAHRRRQVKQLGLNITSPMYGWEKVGRDQYRVVEEEAFFYRKGFELARQGLGYYRISEELYKLGARSRKEGKISPVQWRKMLLTERAYGCVVLHREEYDFERKKRRKLPGEEWVYIENALPPIVSREEWEEAGEVLRGRSRQKRDVLVGAGYSHL